MTLRGLATRRPMAAWTMPLVLGALLIGTTVGAEDIALRGTVLLVKPGKLVRLTGQPAGAVLLPSAAALGSGNTLRVFDLGGGAGGDDAYLLPGTWKAFGKGGLRYHGTGAPADPCTVVLLKRTAVKAVCRGAAVTLAPPFAGDAGVILSLGVTRVCATFGGRTVKNETGALKRVAAPSGACPADGFVTTTSTNPGGGTTTTTVTLPPGPHLMINEIDYDQPGPDTREFVEVFNPHLTAAPLAGLALVFVDGTTNTEYLRVDLTPGGSIPAGECLVVGASAVSVLSLTAVKISVPAFDAGDAIRNGAPDGVLLLDTMSGLVLDRFSYEGAITAATVSGIPFPVSLVEGAPLPTQTADSDTISGSLIRDPSGVDSDNAASDWAFTTVPTPGAPNLRF